MNQNHLISIIIPVYNVEKYLNQCIESVVNQTYSNLEIILIDDGSPDNCPMICDEWGKRDNRITVIHKKNGGLSSARNAGLAIAHGDFIGFVDSDDFVESDMYERLLNAIKINNADIACCGRNLVNENGVKTGVIYTSDNIRIYTESDVIKNLFYGINYDEAIWDKIYHKEFFDNIKFPEGEINEDIVLMVKKFINIAKLVHIGEAKYNYRFNLQGITKSSYSSKKRDTLNHINYIKKYVSENHKELLADYFFLQARYSKNQLISILISKKAKKEFREDYIAYRHLLNEAIKYVIASKIICKKEKIYMLLLKYRLWGFCYKLKNLLHL